MPLPAPCYIVSDAHLGAAPANLERVLVSFLRHLPGRAGSLLINGDLFDFWFEWRRVMPRGHFRTLSALAELREAGMPVLMIGGNHDCWGGEILTHDVGIDFHLGPWDGELGGWRSHVEHGDGLRLVEDRAYRRLRWVLRHPVAIRAFRWLHPDWSSRLASGSSGASRVHRARDGGSGLRRVALEHLARHPDTELVVFGHSHIPLLARAGTGGVYANPGAWLDAPTYLVVHPERVELRQWKESAEGDLLDALDRRAQESLPVP
jgi:UDP-2,3-diacylglucosamine hydrolase